LAETRKLSGVLEVIHRTSVMPGPEFLQHTWLAKTEVKMLYEDLVKEGYLQDKQLLKFISQGCCTFNFGDVIVSCVWDIN